MSTLKLRLCLVFILLRSEAAILHLIDWSEFWGAAHRTLTIVGCEGCSSDDAELPFDNVLDRVTGNDPSVTDYNWSEPIRQMPGRLKGRGVLSDNALVWIGGAVALAAAIVLDDDIAPRICSLAFVV